MKKYRLLLYGTTKIAYHIAKVLEKNNFKCTVLSVGLFGGTSLGALKSYIHVIKEIFRHDAIHFLFSPTPFFGRSLFVFLAKFLRKKVIVMWIGGDEKLLDRKYRYLIAKIANKFVDKHFAVAPWLSNKLKKYGIQSEVLYAIPNIKIPREIPELPNKDIFLIYLAKERFDNFNGDMIFKAIRKLPETEFFIVANDGKGFPKFKNVKYLGYIPYEKMPEIYRRVKGYIRITKRDGFPSMIVESLLYGRYVIFNRKIPHTIFANDLRSLIMAIKKIKQLKEPNKKGREWILSLITHTEEKIATFYKDLFKGQN